MKDDRISPEIKQLVAKLHEKYVDEVRRASAQAEQNGTRNPQLWIGTVASNRWAKRAEEKFKKAVLSPDTVVTTGDRGGRLRFDLVLRVGGRKIFFETQTSDYHDKHKKRQMFGHALALTEGTVRPGLLDLYVKLFGTPGPASYQIYTMQDMKAFR